MEKETPKPGYEDAKKTDMISRSKLPNVGTKLEELADDTPISGMPASFQNGVRYYGVRPVLEVVDDLVKTMGIRTGQTFQFEMIRACCGKKWYIFGEGSEYGNGISNEYLIESDDKTKKVCLETIGQLVASLVKINKETGQPFTKEEMGSIFVDVRPYLPNILTQKPTKKESEIKTKNGSVSVRLETGTFRAKFE
jgi:hypothetical protein